MLILRRELANGSKDEAEELSFFHSCFKLTPDLPYDKLTADSSFRSSRTFLTR